MNTGQANQEKRTIRVKDFLDDFRGGVPDESILKKYHLTPVGLEKFYGMLLERGILASEEIDERYRQESLREAEARSAELEKSSFICPCCLSSHDTMFDICPNCGVSFQELMSRSAEDEEGAAEKDTASPSNISGGGNQGFGSLADGRHEDPLDASANDILADTASRAAKRDIRHEDFLADGDVTSALPKYDDALDEIIPGMPLEYVDDAAPQPSPATVHCESCDTEMQPALRDVYDRSRSYFALLLAGASLMLGVIGLTALSLLNSYSLARLLVVYGTGLFLLSGVAFLAAGSFMYLARERVFYCSSCSRVFPRG